MNKNFLTQNQLTTLYSRSYYLLSILLQLKIVWTEAVPTAGVGFVAGNVELVINPKFYSNLTENQQLSLLLHEALHVAYGHLEVDKSLYDDKTRLNVAMDLVINSNEEINYLKDAGIGVFAEQFNLPLHETTHFYYVNLPENVGEQNPQYEGQHGHEGLPAAAESKVKEILAKASKACEVMRYKPQAQKTGFNWKAALANYISSSDSYDRKSTYKKSNRRSNNWNIPGTKKLRDKKVFVVIDTSGSMISMLEKLVGQVCEIAESGGAEVEWVCCDTAVTAPVKYKRGSQIELTGGGGTAYQPGLNAATDADIIIYLGDMEHFDALKKPKTPVIWVNVVGSQKPKADFGKFLQVG